MTCRRCAALGLPAERVRLEGDAGAAARTDARIKEMD